MGVREAGVEPGPFRTDGGGRSLHQTPSTLPEYADAAAARMEATSEYSGTQAGDPARAATAMIAITEHDNPPRHLVMGAWGYDAVTNKLKERLAQIEAWKQTSVDTDFPS